MVPASLTAALTEAQIDVLIVGGGMLTIAVLISSVYWLRQVFENFTLDREATQEARHRQREYDEQGS